MTESILLFPSNVLSFIYQLQIEKGVSHTLDSPLWSVISTNQRANALNITPNQLDEKFILYATSVLRESFANESLSCFRNHSVTRIMPWQDMSHKDS